MALKSARTNTGFSLIEMLIAMSLFATLMVMSGDYIINAFRATRFHEEQETALQNARRGVEFFTKEVRGANSTVRGNYPLVSASANLMTFYTDEDMDDQMEKVTYTQVNGTLYKVVRQPGILNDYLTTPATSTISIYITNGATPTFTYYDNDYAVTNVINRIRLVKVILIVNVTPETAPNDYYLESDVHLRNLKDNL
jgi:prepilin-type N-terminal cleavage/methylation domain-containing protein